MVTDVNGAVTITGNHNYTEEGTYYIHIHVVDDGGKTTDIYGSTTVGDANLTPGTISTTTPGVENVTNAAISASVTDAAGTASMASDFTAGGGTVTIDWNTGSSGANGSPAADGTLMVTDVNGAVTITGNHNYTEEGTYYIHIHLVDDGGKTADIYGSTSVTDPQLTNLADAHLPSKGTEGTPIGAITGIASFTDPGGAEAVGDYTATIHWGDGKTDTGTVVHDSGNNFHVNAPNHTYSEEGPYTEYVTLTHDALASVPTPGQTINISDPFSWGKYPNVNGLLSGDSVTLSRKFSDPVPTDGAWTVTIDDGAGDPLQTLPTIPSSTVPPQSFTFTLSYNVAALQTFTVTVTVSDQDGDPHVNTFTVTVDADAVSAAAPLSVASTALTPLSSSSTSTNVASASRVPQTDAKSPKVNVPGLASSVSVPVLGTLANVVPDELAAEIAQLPLSKGLKLPHS
jgi:hypothetical protein